MWLKYSDEPILNDFWDRDPPKELGAFTKPNGFWFTDDTEDCWRSWCLAERFGLSRLTHKHEVVLDESDILILRTAYEMDAFTRQFSVEKWWGPAGHPRKYRNICIDWREVARRYAGIIITPYQWSRRMWEGYSWYYPWDCASGCVWKASAIREVRLIEIDHAVAEEREAA